MAVENRIFNQIQKQLPTIVELFSDYDNLEKFSKNKIDVYRVNLCRSYMLEALPYEDFIIVSIIRRTEYRSFRTLNKLKELIIDYVDRMWSTEDSLRFTINADPSMDPYLSSIYLFNSEYYNDYKKDYFRLKRKLKNHMENYYEIEEKV